MKANFTKRIFEFKLPSGTSRGILTEKTSWFLHLKDVDFEGIGECSVIKGLSPDFSSDIEYENKLEEVCSRIDYYSQNIKELIEWPSILFGLEMALLNLKTKQKGVYFRNEFAEGKKAILINGLIWMGEPNFMLDQVQTKINQGFSCIKMKIGAIDFNKEIAILQKIRSQFSKNEIELRVDANGAFNVNDAFEKLNDLAKLEIHSIEQPIAVGQIEGMRELCQKTPVPIALDEELIGVNGYDRKYNLLRLILPQYIILKPSLHGGISGCLEWIEIAEELGILWWITSALESNVGLDAIAQFCGEFNNPLPQGLGTGGLYVSNFDSPLKIENGTILRKLNSI
jgi:o-succinylbenzoate synthase